MPTPPYAKLRASINGGAPSTGGLTASFGQSVALTAENTSGWYSALWQIYGYPPGFSAPAGWSTDAQGVIFYQPTNPTSPPPSFNLPASGANNWGKFSLRLSVNGNPLRLNADGTPNAAFVSALTDEATMIELASPGAGMPGIAVNETTQYDALRLWVGDLMASLRKLDAQPGILVTIASVTHSSNNPYTVLANDALIEVDVSGGVATVNMPASPATGERHSIKNVAGDASVSNITVGGGGHNIEDPNSLQTFAASVAMKVKGGSVTWMFDGTHWVIY